MKNRETEKGRRFLDFVGSHEAELRSLIKAGLRLDEEEMKDLFPDTVLRVYSAIEKGAEVDDFKNYFFMSARGVKLDQERRRKSRDDKMDRTWLDSHEVAEEHGEARLRELGDRAVKKLIVRLAQQFGFEVAGVFLLHKIKGRRFAYDAIADEADIDKRSVVAIMREIASFIENDEDIKSIRKLIDHADDN